MTAQPPRVDREQEGLPYTGIATFLGWPFRAAGPLEPASGRDLVAMGIPYDEGTPYRSGSRFAPRAIRDASMRLRFATGDGLNIYDIQRRQAMRLGSQAWDQGDVAITPGNQERSFTAISGAVSSLRARNAIPVALGGDNSITYPLLRGLGHPDLVVIQLDAHLDYGGEYFGSPHGNSTPLRAARRGGFCKQVVHIGTRGYDNSESDLRASEDDGNVIITADECRRGAAAAALAALPLGAPVYVSLDIDVADPSIAPGTGYLEPGGLDYPYLRELLIAVGERCEVVGCELVELSPMFDLGGATSLLASHLLVDLLSARGPATP